jgi:hypothetical protein
MEAADGGTTGEDEEVPFGDRQLRWKLLPSPLRNYDGFLYSGLFRPEEYEIQPIGKKKYLIIPRRVADSNLRCDEVVGMYKRHEWAYNWGHRIEFYSMSNSKRRIVAQDLRRKGSQYSPNHPSKRISPERLLRHRP